MNNTNKQHLADKLDNYFRYSKKLGIPVIKSEFVEQDASTVKGSIYNKVFKHQIEMQKLHNQYVKEGKEIDITKASSRIKQLDEKIEKTKKAIENFSKSYQEEVQKLQESELQNESSLMKRIAILNKYQTLSENMENLPAYQSMATELNDLAVEKYLIEKKVQQYELENDALIKEIQRKKQMEKVEQYLQSKEL